MAEVFAVHEYVGNIHMHSTYSDGGLTIPAIAEIASRNQLDFIILSDHQNLTGLEKGQEGYYDRTLVLIGMEVNEKVNHYLAMNIDQTIPDNETDPQQVIDDVNRQGGIGVIAHPVEKGSRFYHQGLTFEWDNWQVQGFQGIEIWNYLSRWRDEFTSILAGLQLLIKPSISLHKGPYRETLDILDRYQTQGHRVFAYGGSDAHGIVIKCPLIRTEIGSYQQGFTSINMHILTADALVQDYQTDRQNIYRSLANGCSWVACDYYRDSRGFRFFADSSLGRAEMGSSILCHNDLTLQVRTPVQARLNVYRSGKRWASSYGTRHTFPVNRPGVYRLEAQHKRGCSWQPWIYSNPIWVQ